MSKQRAHRYVRRAAAPGGPAAAPPAIGPRRPLWRIVGGRGLPSRPIFKPADGPSRARYAKSRDNSMCGARAALVGPRLRRRRSGHVTDRRSVGGRCSSSRPRDLSLGPSVRGGEGRDVFLLPQPVRSLAPNPLAVRFQPLGLSRCRRMNLPYTGVPCQAEIEATGMSLK